MIENPVFYKEVITKMRGRQSRQVLIAIATILILFILWCYYEAIYYIVKYGGGSAGKDGWEIAFSIQAVLIWALAPALTANAVSQEREQQTWEMLLFTRLTASEIMLGKLFARLIPMVALLGAFFPFMAFCYIRSDLTARDFFTVYLLFTVWTLFLSTTALFMSWLFKRTPTAIAVSYLVVFLLVVGTALVNQTLSAGGPWLESPVWWLNPFRIASAVINVKNDTYAAAIISVSTVTFLAIGAFLLWRMISHFRALSVE